MTDELGEAIGAILGIAFGGLLLLTVAPELNQVSAINLTAIGIIFLFAAVIFAAVLVYAGIRSVIQ